MKETLCDVTIAGGGIVGSVLALLLVQAGFRIQLIDSTSPKITNNFIPDLRVLAISYTSVKLLQHLGCWQRIDKRLFAPYHRLETWEWPSATVIFDSTLLNLPELGCFIESRRLQKTLWKMFTEHDLLTLHCPASIKTMIYDGYHWKLSIDDGSLIKSRLLVGADGSSSWVRKQAGISVNGWQYSQSCLLLSITVEQNQDNGVTWQVFHPSGPRAFLPLYGQWRSLVWYDHTVRIRQLQALPLLTLAQEVQAAFPSRLGSFQIHDIASFPLMCCHVKNYIKPGLALIGDAAHTINPLAGQGVNLGVRDAHGLAEILINARNCDQPWSTLEVLKGYQHLRYTNNLLMQLGVDIFYSAFSNNFPLLLLARNFGLIFVQHAVGIKKYLLRYALGL